MLDGLVVRIRAGLVPACSSLDDGAAVIMVERLGRMQQALALVEAEARGIDAVAAAVFELDPKRAAVEDDVTGLEMRVECLQGLLDRLPGRDHEEDPARPLERVDQPGQALRAREAALRMPGDELLHRLRLDVPDRHPDVMVGEVEGQVGPHGPRAHQPEVGTPAGRAARRLPCASHATMGPMSEACVG